MKNQDRPTELTDAERQKLGQAMSAQQVAAERIGYALRGEEQAADQCVVAEMPGTPTGEVSVCGAKDFLIDEVRRFTREDGDTIDVRCASSAVLGMTDSPVHVHAATTEYYVVLAGSGRMVLGEGENERVVAIREGSVVLLPPGQPHGVAADDPAAPVRALLTFSPGLAPKECPEFRDERIVYARTSERLKHLVGDVSRCR